MLSSAALQSSHDLVLTAARVPGLGPHSQRRHEQCGAEQPPPPGQVGPDCSHPGPLHRCVLLCKAVSVWWQYSLPCYHEVFSLWRCAWVSSTPLLQYSVCKEPDHELSKACMLAMNLSVKLGMAQLLQCPAAAKSISSFSAAGSVLGLDLL